MGFLTVDETTYMPLNAFTTVELGCEKGNNAYCVISKTNAFENGKKFLNLFNELWNDNQNYRNVTEEVIENIATAYNEIHRNLIYFIFVIII